MAETQDRFDIICNALEELQSDQYEGSIGKPLMQFNQISWAGLKSEVEV